MQRVSFFPESLVALALLCCCCCWASTRVAVVGGGIGGSYVAYELARRSGGDVAVTVFEKRHEVGGRVHTDVFATPDGPVSVDLGGSLFHTKYNPITMELVKRLGLEWEGLTRSTGFWDGSSFVFEQSGSAALATLRALRRYRLAPIRFNSWVGAATSGWMKIYDAQEPWDNVTRLMESVGLAEFTRSTLNEWARQQGLDGRFLDEIVVPVIRDMYTGDPDVLTPLSALISMAGASGGGEVKNGTQLLPRRLMSASKATVRTHTEVREIALKEDGLFHVKLAKMRLVGFGGSVAGMHREYKKCHNYAVFGRLRTEYFGKSRQDMVDCVMTTNNPRIPFNFLSISRRLSNGTDLIAISSENPITSVTMESLVEGHRVLDYIPWRAYPVLKVGIAVPPFRLHQRAFYLNAFESVTSVIEGQLVAAKNAVDLAMSHLRSLDPPQQQQQKEL
eukprot:m51a1_g5193 putative prenylcysteine oxidase 1 (448) ;mRNA; f:202780-204730